MQHYDKHKTKTTLSSSCMGNVTRGMEQRENPIERVTKKGTHENIECECDHCQTKTMQLSCTTISESPQQILYINLNRSLNRFDRSVANTAYYVHDKETS